MNADQSFPADDYDRLRAVDEHGVAVIPVVWRARNARAARHGLLGRDTLAGASGLAIATCSVHMVGMRFALDLVWLDRRGRVHRIDAGVRGGMRMRVCLRARTCIELAAGQASALGLAPGCALSLS